MLKQLTALSMFAVLALGTGTALAQPGDLQTYFTFSSPVTLPGVTLPAGTYLFRLANPGLGRNAIQVLSADGKKPYAILLTIPNQLKQAPRNPQVRFMEAAATVPPPVKSWWYPGTSTGYEFIYPKAQALALAKASTAPVLTTKTETAELKTADLTRVTPSGAEAPVAEPAPAAEAGKVLEGEITLAPQQPQQARVELPKTASSIPAAALSGTVLMLAGIGLSLWRRRQV